MNKLDSNFHLFLQGKGLEDTGIRMPDQQGTPPEGSRALTYLQAQFSESNLECEESGSDSGLTGPPVGRVEFDGLFSFLISPFSSSASPPSQPGAAELCLSACSAVVSFEERLGPQTQHQTRLACSYFLTTGLVQT